jgi:hypothetical protein
MMVDISHVSPTVMSQVLTLSEAPVIFSHSSARALTDHVRNVPDSILARMKSNGGVVMVNFVTAFVSEPYRRWIGDVLPTLALASSDSAADRILREHRARRGPAPRATVKDLADHVEHIRRVAGIDHVGIGADFYGAVGDENQVQGLEDVSKYPDLFAELIRRGWSDADLRKLAGENMLRVLGEVESVSARVRKERPPSNATIEQLDGKRGWWGRSEGAVMTLPASTFPSHPRRVILAARRRQPRRLRTALNIAIAQSTWPRNWASPWEQMGVISAWGFQLAYALFQIPGGFLGDRYGARLTQARGARMVHRVVGVWDRHWRGRAGLRHALRHTSAARRIASRDVSGGRDGSGALRPGAAARGSECVLPRGRDARRRTHTAPARPAHGARRVARGLRGQRGGWTGHGDRLVPARPATRGTIRDAPVCHDA